MSPFLPLPRTARSRSVVRITVVVAVLASACSSVGHQPTASVQPVDDLAAPQRSDPVTAVLGATVDAPAVTTSVRSESLAATASTTTTPLRAPADAAEIASVLAVTTVPSTTTTTTPIPRFVTRADDGTGPLRFQLDLPEIGMARTVRTLSAPVPAVLLTFDAGSDRGHTVQILDTLAVEGVVAAFGLTGAWAQEHPDLVRRISDEGHTIINHTWTHRSMTRAGLRHAERQIELDDTEEVLRDLTGVTTRPWFRPPLGDVDDGLLDQLGTHGYLVNVMWSIDSLGWRGLSAEQIVARCLDRLEPGAIILMHVGSQSLDADAVAPLLSELRARGYTTAGLPLVDRVS